MEVVRTDIYKNISAKVGVARDDVKKAIQKYFVNKIGRTIKDDSKLAEQKVIDFMYDTYPTFCNLKDSFINDREGYWREKISKSSYELMSQESTFVKCVLNEVAKLKTTIKVYPVFDCFYYEYEHAELFNKAFNRASERMFGYVLFTS
jgi:hypothetical protein